MRTLTEIARNLIVLALDLGTGVRETPLTRMQAELRGTSWGSTTRSSGACLSAGPAGKQNP
jgi:hypothetical protein